MNYSWYLKRLSAMGPGEIAQRLADRFHEAQWRRRYFGTDAQPAVVTTDRQFVGGLSRARAADAPRDPRENLLRIAECLLAGEWRTFAITREDVTHAVDWHFDPKTQTRAPADAYAFDIPFVGVASRFDTKYVWELSRHCQTTLLAMAYWLSGDERYASAAAGFVHSWIGANPFLAGIQWASGIELGMRLVAFAWTRRLLTDWPEVSVQFENNESFARTIVQHQWLLAHRRSYGSSANNHLIYEMAGLYVSACCMPWSAQTGAWRDRASHVLESEFQKQIFPEGYTRELASDYNGFVLEALIICLTEGSLGDARLSLQTCDCARRMLDWLATHSDCRGHPPRQGDSDDATGLLLDAPDYDRWRDFSYFREAWSGQALQQAPSLRAWLLAPLVDQTIRKTMSFPPKREPDTSRSPDKSRSRIPAFAGRTKEGEPHQSGLVILRARSDTPSEIWCAFDTGTLGYLSIAAHGHADALALEFRYGGAPVLVDPGTFAYCGPWRDWFRSTAAHNTVEFGGTSQSVGGGPFLWTRHARTKLLDITDQAGSMGVEAEHDGYTRRPFRGQHRRSVTLDRETAVLTIRDTLNAASPVPLRMSWHLHPGIGMRLEGHTAQLACGSVVLVISLPDALVWEGVRGGETIGAGWFSPSFDVKCPTTTLIGEGRLAGPAIFETVVRFPN